MFDDPFFTSNTSRPVQQDHRHSSPIILPVPVHFFASDPSQIPLPPPKESSALKIQKLFRGFLVRKSVKKISAIRNQVREIETSVNDTGIVDSIRVDAKERLRVNETLMSLLFKLDSIRGVDFGVREFRKHVIKKAIALQEKLDSIRSEQALESTSVNDKVVDVVIDAEMEVAKEIDVNCDSVKAVDGKKRSIELLERLMDDNEKMMTLMTQVFKRNEMQTRMINSLSRRVEQLEKAFVCDKHMKKKKRHSA